ncbi:MAG: glycosyltransferase 87 family protein [Candidatus Dormiibacterota bacterium]
MRKVDPRTAVGALVVGLVGWALLVLYLPIALNRHVPLGEGTDFFGYRAVAWDLLHRLNPYQIAALHRGMHAAGVGGSFPPYYAFALPLWVGFLFLWAPSLPLTAGFIVWTALSIGLVLASAVVLARWLGWRRPWLVGLVVVATPAAIVGYMVGQLDALLLFLLTLVLVAASSKKYFWAGLAAGFFVALKFEVAWPLAPFLLIVLWNDRHAFRRALEGELVAGMFCLVVPMLFVPSWPTAWVHKLVGFTASIPNIQPDPAGLVGLVRVLPRSWHITPGLHDPITWILVLVCLIAFFLLGLSLLRGHIELEDRERLCVGLGVPLVLWALCSPYGHSDDILVLLPVVLLLLSSNWRGLRDTWVWLFCFVLAALPGYTILALLVLGPRANSLSFTSLGTLWVAYLVASELVRRQSADQRARVDKSSENLHRTGGLEGGAVHSRLS